MQKPNLPEIAVTDPRIIVQIKASELKGLWIDPQTLETAENLCGKLIKNYQSKVMDLCRLAYSLGDDSRIEITYRIGNREDSKCNIHIHQELLVFEENGRLRFECPVSEDDLECDVVYLRSDYPLFASAEFLNIKA